MQGRELLSVLIRAIAIYVLVNAVLGFIGIVITVIATMNANNLGALLGPLVQVIVGFTLLNRADQIANWTYR